MYCSFFGLQEKPFGVTPDPRFLFLSQSHQEALGHLLYGIEERKGFIAITGEVGTGKTILCRALLERLAQHTQTALILNSFLSDVELLRSINEDFGIPAQGITKKELIDELNRFLISGFREGHNAVLIIDEAQNLTTPVLEQIRMLSNLETERGKLLQIVLVGQPELRGLLERPDLRQLNQRIAVRYHLRPLDRGETADYINHRLLVAGSHGSVKFSAGTLDRIYRASEGIPRKINLLCDRVLLTAYVRGTAVIDRQIVRHAKAEINTDKIGGAQPSGRGARRRRQLIAAGTAGGFLLLGGTFWLGVLQPKMMEAPGIDRMTAIMADEKSPEGGRETNSPGTADPPLIADDSVQAKAELGHGESPASKTAQGVFTTGELPGPSGPEPEKVASISRRVSGENARLRALIWEYTRALRQGGEGEKLTFATVAGSFGLEVLPIWTDLRQLKQFRVASVVETFSPETPEPAFFIPYASSPEGVELMDAVGDIRRFTDGEITKIWFGRAYLFYRSGKDLRITLSRGKRGQEVQTLQQQLGALGYLEGTPTGVFDGETAEAVRHFQRDHHLQTDGIAGPATKIMLYHLSGRPLDRVLN